MYKLSYYLLHDFVSSNDPRMCTPFLICFIIRLCLQSVSHKMNILPNIMNVVFVEYHIYAKLLHCKVITKQNTYDYIRFQ